MTECNTDNKGIRCPICGCPVKQVFMATILAFITIFLFEWGFHGVYMMPDYVATASMWRDEAGMQELFHISVISQAMRALAIAGLFCWVGKGCGGICCPVKGAKVGLLVGLLMGACALGSYAWLPLETMDIPLKWLTGDILLGIIIGVVLSVASRICGKSKSCTKEEG